MASSIFLIWFTISSSYEEDLENSEDNEDDVEDEEEEGGEEEENATAAAEPAPVPAAEEPINGIYLSRGPHFPNNARVKGKR